MNVSALPSFISLPMRRWLHLHAALEAARADAHERDAVAVLRIHVRLDLEHEAGERRLGRLDDARASPSRGCGGGASSTQRLQDLLHAEVVDRRAEEHRRLLAGEERRRGRTAWLAPRTSSMSSRSAARSRRGNSVVEARIVEALDELGRRRRGAPRRA